MSKVTVDNEGFTFDSLILRKEVDQALEKARARREQEIAPDYTRNPPYFDKKMFPGVLGELVNRICQHSEATPPAVAVAIISRLCALIGRPCKHKPSAPWFSIGDSIRHLRPFFLVVGPTGHGRKGTSDDPAEQLFKRLDEQLFFRHSNRTSGENLSVPEQYWPLPSHSGGLSSGEGLIWRLRDDDSKDVAGEPDKRLFVLEPEFGNVLRQSCREGNTLSCIVRILWDGKSLEPLTKNNRYRATDPHVCVVGHITGHELLNQLKPNDLHNGLINRFLVVYSKRHKLMPFPQPVINDSINVLVEQLADVVEFSWSAGEITMNCPDYWEQCYLTLENMKYGNQINAMASRASLYTRMLSAIFALMDQRSVIREPDIESAMCWIQYWIQSLIYLFDGEKAKQKAGAIDSLSNRILKFITEKKMVSQTDIYKFLQCNTSASDIQKALESLLHCTPPLIRMTVESGKTKPIKKYSLSY